MIQGIFRRPQLARRLLRTGAMPIDAWLSLSFTIPMTLAYTLWAVGRMPRFRRASAVLGVLAFVAACVVHSFE